MKVIINQNIIKVFLRKNEIKAIDSQSKENLEKYFRKIIITLKEIYNIEMIGYYNINVYLDKYYGTILEIEKEFLDYFEYTENQIDMRIKIEESSFLYQMVDLLDINELIKDKIQVINNNNNSYIKIKEQLSDLELGKLLEFSSLIYGKEAIDIMKNCKIIDILYL